MRNVRAGLISMLILGLSAGCGGGGGGGSSTNDDAALAALSVSAGTLSPAFSTGTTAYAVSVPNGTASFTVTPTAHEPRATVQVKQGTGAYATVGSGSASAALAVPAVASSSTITVRVTAQDGSTTRSYAIALTQAAAVTLSSDATLAALAVSAGSLSPAFSADSTSYAVAVPNGTASFAVTPTVHEAHATVQVKQDTGAYATVASGSASAALAVPAVSASSTVAVRVTAQDGTTTKDYVVALTQAAASTAAFTVYAVGDSTMAYYDPTAYPNQRGWGQMFPQFLVGDVGYVDAAKNGRSSKSFYDEGSWETSVRSKLVAGDYVLIQFAHNDEKTDGLDDPSGIGTAPFGTYQDYLRKYVYETVAAGATPILVTPVVRRYFSGSALTGKACHDLTGVGDPSIPVDQDLNYVEAMKQVATEKGVQVVDMTASTKALVEQYGPTDSKSIIYTPGDGTHLKPLGATLFAQLAAKEMLEKGILAAYLNPVADLVVSPTAIDFGTLYLGMTVDKVVSVTGLALSPDAGNVTLTAPDGFQVGLAGGTFASTLQVPYAGGLLAPTNVSVRFRPAAAQAYSGTVTIAPDSGTARSVAVAGTGVPVPTGG